MPVAQQHKGVFSYTLVPEANQMPKSSAPCHK